MAEPAPEPSWLNGWFGHRSLQRAAAPQHRSLKQQPQLARMPRPTGAGWCHTAATTTTGDTVTEPMTPERLAKIRERAGRDYAAHGSGIYLSNELVADRLHLLDEVDRLAAESHQAQAEVRLLEAQARDADAALRDFRAEIERLRAQMAAHAAIWSRPVGPNSFYVNGFATMLDQLHELFSMEVADEVRSALASDDGVQCGHWQCAIAADDDEAQP